MTTITAAMVKELRDRTNAAMMACKKALQESNGDLEEAIDILRRIGAAKAVKWANKTAAEGMVIIAISSDQKKAFMAEVNSETDFVARDASFVLFTENIAKRGLEKNIEDVASLLALPVDSHTLSTIDDVRIELINKVGENIQIRRVAFLSAKDGIVGHYRHGSRIGVLVTLDSSSKSTLPKSIAMHIAAFQPQAISIDQVPAAFLKKEKKNLLAQAKKSEKPADIIEKMVTGQLNKLLKEVSLEEQPFIMDSKISVGDLLKLEKVKVCEFIRFEVGAGIEKKTRNFASEVMAQVQRNR
ncbi:translation elongation factor Ts [Coxiella endosymbiont of Amblyomma nuttalli]|uniref:translation elongation factor Ts n=1 Tax=Coxiella endosymbiont of Amblyomma nuttalli TaxID=2749996 RepID=UPI001BA9AAD8|nr:translation elongation factor Ts [Coxiella endosymbiont of Amblyomma nuttalli]QTS83700.1 Elongation factor Ts [Coxiella endosymbiont of Amblyomma nuttalli]